MTGVSRNMHRRTEDFLNLSAEHENFIEVASNNGFALEEINK